MKKGRPLLSLAAILFLLFQQFPVTAEGFEDIDNHWAQEYVLLLTDREILSGYEDNTFRPEEPITRAEFFSIVNHLAKLEKTYTVTFADVSKKAWYYSDVAKGIKAGYLLPTTGNLNPDVPMKREETIGVLGYFYDLKGSLSVLDRFQDHREISQNCAPAAAAMVEMGILDGKGDGTFQPKGNITRGEMAKIICLLLEEFGEPEEKVVLDSKIKFGPKDLYD